MTRRQFLIASAAVAALPAWPEGISARTAPYLDLEKFIPLGSDEFGCEKLATELEDALQIALAEGKLPISSLGSIRRAKFHALPDNLVFYEISSTRDNQLLHTTGYWKIDFATGKLNAIHPLNHYTASSNQTFFNDVTEYSFRNINTLRDQLSKGIPYWRCRLDPATGIDLYGSNGIAVGDIDGDGRDEVYVCQPGGLPNRLLKFQDDGTLIDITERWGAQMLDDTSAALFLDLRNSGHQDLVILRSSGPILLVNEGSQFRVRTDAFSFKTAPQGGFTGMAAADYDRDGKLDLYLCCYVYFQSEAQYTYAAPYHDARNGPPNFLFRNQLAPDGSGSFLDVTAETGMNENNNRFSFAPAWCDFNGDGWPDLYVANDFGRKNLYVNHKGHFRDEAQERYAEDIGPGMSASWFDFNHDDLPDIYVANMWTAAGQRITHDPHFLPLSDAAARPAYLGHTMGNSLLEQSSNGGFHDVSAREHVAFGRWAWAAGGHDFDNDGSPEIFVTCGMLTNAKAKPDLGSFFWRQVVNKTPAVNEPSTPYQNGWNALNQFIREDYSWNGNEPNVFYAKRDGQYRDFSGCSGLDFADDSRAFAILDFDGDGRVDLLLKSRLGPQLRVLQNNCAQSNHSIAFQLRGVESNRDAIGSRIKVDHQTKWLAAGSEFLSQHSKQLLFGLGEKTQADSVIITWPSGIEQHFGPLSAGRTYFIVEGDTETKSHPFRSAAPLPKIRTKFDNSLGLSDTWFLDPVPLPDPQKGPGLLALDFTSTNADLRSQYALFRRYLFDWRAPLEPQLNLLLNSDGHAIKIYAAKPSQAKVETDLSSLSVPALDRAVPFPGYFIGERYRDFFKFGAAFLWAGYYAQSLPYLEQVLLHTPRNLRTLLLAAQVADELNLSPKAEEFYRRAVSVDSKSAEANNGLGLSLAKRGENSEARKYFEHAIEIRRDYADAINNLGALYTQQGQLKDAIAAFQYGIRVAPDDDILYLNLGRAFVQTGQLDRAREVMGQLLERKPGNEVANRALRDLAGRNE